MQDKEFTTPLIQTKLNRPVQTAELVPRPRLTEWLDQRWKQPLILVSAPAGHGQSTLVSEWIQSWRFEGTETKRDS